MRAKILSIIAIIVLFISFKVFAELPGKDSIKKNEFTSSEICGKCHLEIHRYWKNSLHALSISDPIFDVAYMQALKHDAKKAKEGCLICHAPVVLLNADYELKNEITNEGISCDFCHTITGVNFANQKNPYSFKVGVVKRGPLKKASSPVHKVEYSELHSKSEFCAGCHEFQGENGVKIMGTYSEWKEGPYAKEGKQCQDCHMPMVEGRVVDPSVKESGKMINLHDIQGGHSLSQLSKAMDVGIMKVEKNGEEVNVEVRVKNAGSGHAVPTGIPSRKLVLEVSLGVKDRVVDTQRKEYQKVVGDVNGKELNEDWGILMKGAKILTDNRLKAGEERMEHFTFRLPKGYEGILIARLFYLYTPYTLQKQEIRVGITEGRRKVE